MARTYKVSDQLYAMYIDEIKSGSSIAAACRKIGIAYSTMYDHIKRIGDVKNIDYHLIRRSQSIAIVTNNEIYTLDFLDKFYKDNIDFIVELIEREVYKLSKKELDFISSSKLDKEVAAAIKKDKKLSVKKGKLYYDNHEICKDLYKLIEVSIAKNTNNSKIMKFVDLLVKNTDKYVIKQLYSFLKHNDIEICDNGYILAYKAVTDDFKDCYSRTFDNSVGKYVSMDRKDVDSDPNRTCSHGLHVGSLKYIYELYSNRTIVKCIVNPADFVSIPTDYDGAKARVCKYKVSSIYKK